MSIVRGGKKGRKIGRNKIKCKRYRLFHRREKNKIKKILKHLKRHPNNLVAFRRIEELKDSLKTGGRIS